MEDYETMMMLLFGYEEVEEDAEEMQGRAMARKMEEGVAHNVNSLFTMNYRALKEGKKE